MILVITKTKDCLVLAYNNTDGVINVNGAPVGIVSVGFTLIFPLTAGMIKNYWV